MTGRHGERGKRILRALSRILIRVVRVLMIVGSALNGSRSGDEQARALYERPDREYRP